jgi:hypothetical protein
MSTRDSQTQDDAKSRRKKHGLYVYCIGERAALEEVFADAVPTAIEDDASLEIVAQDDLAAVVSPVPLDDYGEDELQSRLGDATWTAVRAMRHEKVVEHFARRASVVPLRFGTIYLERARIEQMLSKERESLLAIIGNLRGREEWGLNITYDRAKLMENIISLSPRLREMSERADAASPGQSYLMRKKIDAMRDVEARAETKRVANEIERELSGRSDAAVRLRVLKDEATEQGDVAAKFAFLVERTRFDEFRAVAERLAEEYTRAGFQLELTGPWPAYNFSMGQP